MQKKKRIDETNPGSYGHALHYGSSEDKKHWYICPRYWCLKTNSSISEKDVKADTLNGSIAIQVQERMLQFLYSTSNIVHSSLKKDISKF